MSGDWGLVTRSPLILAALTAHAAAADPFPVRDQNPLLGGLGLPSPMPARIESGQRWSFDAAFNWGSTALIQANARETLLVDAETQEWRFTVRRALTDRLAFQLEAPWRRISGGSLDGFIDDWHDAFGLPEGARPILPHDQMRIVYERDGVRTFDLDSAAGGLGDIAASVGYALHASEASALTAWASVELPTGDAARLTGNDEIDVSIALAAQHRFADRWSAYGQAGVSWLGDAAALRTQQSEAVWSGMAGLAWRPAQPIELKLQLDAHSAAFGGSELDFLNEALMLTVGGAVHFESGWRLDLGVSEDIAVETAPDVVFVIGISSGARF